MSAPPTSEPMTIPLSAPAENLRLTGKPVSVVVGLGVLGVVGIGVLEVVGKVTVRMVRF